MNWRTLSSEEDLCAAHKLSFNEGIKAVMLFKHSTRCGISSTAKSRVESEWAFGDELPGYFLDLLNHRDISGRISTDYAVHHESPQLIAIKNGEVIYHDSHHSISVKSLKEALRD